MLNGERQLRIEITELIELRDTFQILYPGNRKHIFISSKYETFTKVFKCPWRFTSVSDARIKRL